MSRAQRLLFIAIITHVCFLIAKISKEGYLILPNQMVILFLIHTVILCFSLILWRKVYCILPAILIRLCYFGKKYFFKIGHLCHIQIAGYEDNVAIIIQVANHIILLKKKKKTPKVYPICLLHWVIFLLTVSLVPIIYSEQLFLAWYHYAKG